ncbi:FKBP-type peptidyl-prolyl cis-trans isomerase [Microbacterium sp. SORGH_AS 1204]|uniref:FKBP-type peptidyl-prolyl cis-trans isomerase n=1 Tax=Microbacterium sp. SORGH_AS_1204 TaxID=3041785 RepID=UPI00278F5F0B|nr:FKBP-type peptidyl-prolyl cis-trans isomerase [Microbacterium sp. SORGH_AS_1204]MDQ1137435.1 FKBP-type peptidyl-prolyl cis-trans isomerase [Microbacterium sp. SORGH_AS_1204]
MRFRPIASLSVAAAAALLLAGCSGSPDQAQSPDASSSADAAECGTPFTGEVPAGLEVSGDFEGPVTVTRPDGFAPTAVQRSTVIEGGGTELTDGDVVRANYTVVDATTGEVLYDTLKTDPTGKDLVLDTRQIFGAALACIPVGSRTVSTFPAGTLGQGSPAYILVADAIEDVPVSDVPPTDGMPTVTVAEDGSPTITMPSAPAPQETRIENLRTSEGDLVEPGDTVTVQYSGALYDGGTVFDSTWQKGTPAEFPTTGVVPGFRKALEGQAVGSRVLAVIPPAEGYGDQDKGSIPPNSTLVFVIDILGVQHAPEATQ